MLAKERFKNDFVFPLTFLKYGEKRKSKEEGKAMEFKFLLIIKTNQAVNSSRKMTREKKEMRREGEERVWWGKEAKT